MADHDNNRLLLFSKNGDNNVRCLVKNKIIKPYCLYLDEQNDKLYVGTSEGQVVVYEYYMFVRGDHNIKYNITKITVKSKLSDV